MAPAMVRGARREIYCIFLLIRHRFFLTFFSILTPLPRLEISIPQQFLLIKQFLITHGVFCPSQR